MSQPVAYTPPDYVPPEVAASNWDGPERRSRAPVDQLGRSLNLLCLEASGPYEIVAHLEALGYNSASALARFGVSSHFELAHQLYERTPRIRDRYKVKRKRTGDWATPVAMGLAFVATFLLGAFSQVEMLAPAMVILVWSQVGAAVLQKAKGELLRTEQGVVLAFLVQLGILAIVGSWALLQYGLATLAPTLTWFAVGALLWAERRVAALTVPLLVLLGLVLATLLPVPAVMPQLIVVVAVAAMCLPLAWRDTRPIFDWLRRSIGVALHPFLYGVGQGLLILALLRHEDPAGDVVPGGVLLLLVLLLSQRFLIMLKAALTARLWRSTSASGFRTYAHAALFVYVGMYVLPLLAALIIEAVLGVGGWHFYWFAFGLFGLSLGISVVGFALGNPAGASIPFLLAGVAAVAGMPFLVVSAYLALVLLLVAQLRVRQVGRYAVYLL